MTRRGTGSAAAGGGPELSAAIAGAPPVARWLARFPAVANPVEEVLRAGAAVRAARDAALPPVAPRTVRHRRAATDRLDAELEAAVEALESLAGNRRPRGVAEAVHRTLRALAELRAASHAFGPPRRSRSAEDRAALGRALGAFRAAWSRLQRAAEASHAGRIPWQLELATHAAPETPVASLRITGYDLPGTPAAARPWGARCLISGTLFPTDRHEGPATRYRSLDSCFHVLAPEELALVRRIRTALESLRRHDADVVADSAGVFPALWEDWVAEPAHPSFVKLGLLDFPSLAVSLNNILSVYAERPCFGTRDGDGGLPSLGAGDRRAVAAGAPGADSGYRWLTYGEVRSRAWRLARSLARLGVEPGSRLGILVSANGPEFHLADFAAIFQRLVSVGLQHTLVDEQLAAIAAQAEIATAVVDGPSLGRLLAPELLAGCPSLELIVALGPRPEVPPPPGVRLVGLDELIADEAEPEAGWTAASGVGPGTGVIYGDRAAEQRAAAAGIGADDPADLYTILFTSGSTGRPKGTPVTRRRWAEEMCFDADIWPHVALSFQPPALAADRGLVWRTLHGGGRVGFARRGAALFHDARAVRPTVLDAPPVVWNTLYTEYRAAVSDPALGAAEVAAAKRRLRGHLGGRLAFIATGGAPSRPGVRRAMEELFGIPLGDSYGTTETGNIAVDGVLVAGLDYRLVEAPELGPGAIDPPLARGELAVRTPRTSARYLRAEDDPAEGYTEDGYFLTGDLVELGPGRRCRILGRRKELFKLADSEFVSPEALERRYLSSPRLEALMIAPAPDRGGLVGLAVATDPEPTEAALLTELAAIARRASLRPNDVPRAIVIAPRGPDGMPWTVDNGLLTPSLKLDRRALIERYRDDIEAAWAAAEARREAARAVAGDRGAGVGERLRRLAGGLLSLPPDRVDPRASFAELGGDSMQAMEFLLRIDQVFGGEVQGAPPWREDPNWLLETPLDRVAERIRESRRSASAEPAPTGGAPGAGSPATPARAIDPATRPQPIQARPATPKTATPKPATPEPTAPEPAAPPPSAPMALADAVSIRPAQPLPPPATSADVLVTGANGFLGVHLVAELAATLPPGATVWAMVRAADHGAAARRLGEALRGAALPAPAIGLPGAPRQRIVACAGALDEDRFGWDEALYGHLAAQLGLLYHLGAQVRFGATYADLRQVNVTGTRRLLELATHSTLKAIHFVSSLNVALLVGGGRPAAEEAPIDGVRAADLEAGSAYAVSKWVGERLLAELAERCDGRLRASISRPALISWSARTGRANDGDWLTRVLDSCLEIGAAIGPEEVGVPSWIPETPVSARGLDLVPVDFVAAAIATLGRLTARGKLPAAEGPGGRRPPAFHVSNSSPDEAGLVTVRRLMDLLGAAALAVGGPGGRLAMVPSAEWSSRVEIERAPALAILDQLRRMSPEVERVRADRFAAAMAAAGPAAPCCPPCDAALVETFVRGRRAGG